MYDLLIIGAGPAGYYAARRASEFGKKVCIIEKGHFGGACLNEGCIPTKFMANTASLLFDIKKSELFGIEIKAPKLNAAKMHERKNYIIFKHRQSIEKVLNGAKVKIVKAEARLKDANTVDVSGERINAEYILIATGSIPAETDKLKFDHKNILSSSDILELKEMPSSLVIIGAGYIGCEFACIFNQFGCDVTLIEIESQILPGQDEEIAKRLMQSMKKRGIEIFLNTKVKNIQTKEINKVTVLLENNQAIDAQKLLLTVGRKPNIDNLGLESTGVNLKDDAIAVNALLQTNVKNIYAAGDAIRGYCLAHTAFYEGRLAAENIFDRPHPANYGAVPNCIFTMPEIASAGLTESQAREKGYDVKVASYPFMASSKAHIIDQTEGLVKLVCDSKTGEILGAQILGPEACELIHELVVAINKNMTAKELASAIHAHPTLSEAIQEAARK